MTKKANREEVALYCNNFLNGKYSPGFIALADRIYEFRIKHKQTARISESVMGSFSYTDATTESGNPLSWQQIFSADLALYKRLRTV